MGGSFSQLSYRPGQQNADADGLSRKPEPLSDFIKAKCQVCLCAVPHFQSVLDHSASCLDFNENGETQYLSDIQWRTEQRKDQTLARVLELKEHGF